MQQIKITPEMLTKIENSFGHNNELKQRKTKPCRIKFNGKFVVTISEKTIWRNIGFAKLALNHHLQNCNVYDYYKCKELRKQLEKSGHIEYVEVEFQ